MNPLIKNSPDMNTLFNQFKQNPLRYLTGLNIPPNISNPQQIVQYLAANNQIPPQLRGMVNAQLGIK